MYLSLTSSVDLIFSDIANTSWYAGLIAIVLTSSCKTLLYLKLNQPFLNVHLLTVE